MTTDLAIVDDRLPVMMKSRAVHWVSPETHGRIQQQLQQQSGHTFMRIAELGITINTAEIEGAYAREQYDDLARIRAGMWQCMWKKWHNKKDDCQCRREAEADHRQRLREQAQRESDRPLTDDERAAAHNRLRLMNETGALKKSTSIFGNMFLKGNHKGKAIRQSTINMWEEKYGPTNVSMFEVEEDEPSKRKL